MPHQCTACGHTFPDGSKEMLSGCPECGGTTFQFAPQQSDSEANETPSPEEPSTTDQIDPSEQPDPSRSDQSPTHNEQSTNEDTETHESATTDAPTPATPSEPADSDYEPTDGDSASDSSPDLAALREELNDQFESIKIVEPGRYELNLMELYNREEQIIALREDGRYVIEMPEF